MKILLSNDDGISANGIRVLSEALSKKHDVYIVAPDRERSASSHAITLDAPLRVEELEPKYGAKKCFMTTGTPGDCVKMAVHAILSPEEQPDFVISGINNGANLGADTLYSGTVSCAMEGALMGLPSIAVSLAGMKNKYEDYKIAADFTLDLVEKLKDFDFPPKTVLNVNVPNLDKEDICGVVLTELGDRIFKDKYEKRVDPRGKTYYWMAGELVTESYDSNTDLAVIRNNKISITPLSCNMTAFSLMPEIVAKICSDGSCEW